jgi:hypothetical protein
MYGQNKARSTHGKLACFGYVFEMELPIRGKERP